MKRNLTAFSRGVMFCLLFCMVAFGGNFISCTKTGHFPSFENNASRYTSDVIDKWITMQLRLMRDATGIPNVVFSRYYAYSGVAAFESLAPGTLLRSKSIGRYFIEASEMGPHFLNKQSY